VLAELAFWIPLGCVLYTYAGYPLLLLLVAAIRRLPGQPRPNWQPSVSVLVVVHNEAAAIGRKLDSLLCQDYRRGALEIIVASDGSTDSTAEVVEAYADRGVRLLQLPGPRGKPTALNAAVGESIGEVLVLCDARQRFAPDAVSRLVHAVSDPRVGAVSGELVLEGAAGSTAAEGVGLYWRFEKLLRRLEARVDSSIGVTGAICALRRELFTPIPAGTVLDDVLIPMEVTRRGYRVLFEPGARAHDLLATSRHEYRRKVRTLAGNFQLVWLRPWLLDPRRNRLLWQFVSHKLARLFVPWFLLLLAAATAVLSLDGGSSAWLYRTSGVCQLLFYSLAVVGGAAEHWNGRIRAATGPWAFTLLNLAAAHALFVFARGGARANWRGASE
jgi:poly-beta-1,6-N-acetyl-D-glucosamine synthase